MPPAITAGVLSTPAPPWRIRSAPISRPGPSDNRPVTIQNSEKTTNTTGFSAYSPANQRSCTEAGRRVSAAESDRGAIPVSSVQRPGSPTAPRPISRRAVLRSGGRQPSRPAKSPSRYSAAPSQRGNADDARFAPAEPGPVAANDFGE